MNDNEISELLNGRKAKLAKAEKAAAAAGAVLVANGEVTADWKLVKRLTGLSKPAVYDRLKIGGTYYDANFPRPQKMGLHKTCFRVGELLDWAAAQPRL